MDTVILSNCFNSHMWAWPYCYHRPQCGDPAEDCSTDTYLYAVSSASPGEKTAEVGELLPLQHQSKLCQGWAKIAAWFNVLLHSPNDQKADQRWMTQDKWSVHCRLLSHTTCLQRKMMWQCSWGIFFIRAPKEDGGWCYLIQNNDMNKGECFAILCPALTQKVGRLYKMCIETECDDL